MTVPNTYAVYLLHLDAQEHCVHSEPYDIYVGHAHVNDSHDVEDRISDHQRGHNSKVASKGYTIKSWQSLRARHSTRDAAEKSEGQEARRQQRLGKKVWCDKL